MPYTPEQDLFFAILVAGLHDALIFLGTADFPHLLLLFESFLSSRAVALGPASNRGTPLTLRTPWPTLHGAVCVTCPREAWHSPWLSVSMPTEHRRVSSVCPSMPLVAIMAQSRAQPRVRQLLPREEPLPSWLLQWSACRSGPLEITCDRANPLDPRETPAQRTEPLHRCLSHGTSLTVVLSCTV